jgi:hypothetical protein
MKTSSPKTLSDAAEALGLEVDDLAAIAEEYASGTFLDHRRAAVVAAAGAAEIASELEQLLRSVRAAWGRSGPPREARELVLADDELSPQEKLTMLGFLDCVRHDVDVMAMVDRKTVYKYRHAAERIGLAKLLRRSGLAPLRAQA